MYRKYFKRPFDIACAILALTVFSWLYLLIAILVRIKLGNPVIFKQKRLGKDEKVFTLYKFKSMTDEVDDNGQLLPDSKRLSNFGRFLRASSFDEIASVINILKGDLSIVGPRPLIVEYLPFYKEDERKRHTIKPGLTGLAQVEGRNALDWNEKLSFDVKYVENIKFSEDIRLIIKSITYFYNYKSTFSGEVIYLNDGRVVRPLNIERSVNNQVYNITDVQ